MAAADYQEHKQKIQKLCRVCGKNIVLRRGYVKAKNVDTFKNIFIEAYGIDCQSEPDNTYSKFLCSGCCRKNERLLKKKKDDGTLSMNEFLKAFDFVAHNENCVICTKTESHSMTLGSLDRLLLEFGFEKINLSNSNLGQLTRIYCVNILNQMTGTLVVKIQFKLFNDLTWDCHVYGQNVELEGVPEKIITEKDMEKIKEFFNSKDVCDGIEAFQDVIGHRLELTPPFKNASIENLNHAKIGDKNDYKFVRSENCSYFKKIGSKKVCEECSFYIKKLYVIRSRMHSGRKQGSTEGSSHTNYRYLSHDEKNERLSNLHADKQNLARKFAYWSTKIKDQIEDKGVSIEDDQQDCLAKILKETDKTPFDPNSPQWLLWEQQKLAASKENSKGMRWHPLILRYNVKKLKIVLCIS